MPLTLGNDLTGLVSREVDAAGSKASGLGASLTTGNDVFVEVVDAFLGNSLRDGEVVLGAVAKNTAYSINLLTITDEYLKTIASSLQDGLKTIGSAGPLSADKLAVLQKNLGDKRAQVALLINTADFDGKGLLKGDAKDIQVQVGLNVTDKLGIKVNDLSGGALFRSSITTALNNAVKANIGTANAAGLGTTYYVTANAATEMQVDIDNNVNLFHAALTAAGGSGSGVAMTAAQFGNYILALSDSQKALLDQMAPVGKAFINANGGVNVRGFAAGVAGDFVALHGDANSLAEITAILADDAATNISVVGNVANRVLAQDVFQNALNSVRAEQAAVSNQKSNVVEAADALRATTNVTQKAADSYLKTDYVLTAQQYSETIRTMVASITSLQAANKIPEAAQRLIDALAR
ncbi:hypothetical protein Megvenef_00739 [Candidatus Megaera venefica]|uniref:Flagellin n=2 Tax=Candidatus Megaera venefica TaxID=2055910 RepID=A0ABU5NC65_9RICK|nr:hypothetical protein [Candidatus Megaera venefica]